MSRSLPSRALHAVFGRINKKRQWHELPFPISLLNLLSLRLDLRDMNLFDTSEEIKTEATEEPPAEARTALPGITPERTAQIVAGGIVAEQAMRAFGVREVEICPWALREGIILRRLDELG